MLHITYILLSKNWLNINLFESITQFPATKSTDWYYLIWAAAAVCWQSAGCNFIGPTQTSPAFYWLQLHMRRCDILTEFRVCCSSVRMKQLQFLFSNNRGPEVFWGIMTLIIICHQNDNDHHHHWDETLWTVPVASESNRFYMSTYSAHYTLLLTPCKYRLLLLFHISRLNLVKWAKFQKCFFWCFFIWNDLPRVDLIT